jgi:hypothetical protein
VPVVGPVTIPFIVEETTPFTGELNTHGVPPWAAGSTGKNSLRSLSNGTVNANQAHGATALGGGIYSYNSVLNLVPSTVKGNQATTGYDDIFVGP